MKALVLYYSFSGNTRRVAEALGRRLGAPVAEIRTVEPIRHPFGVAFLNRLKARTPDIELHAVRLLPAGVRGRVRGPALHLLRNLLPMFR